MQPFYKKLMQLWNRKRRKTNCRSREHFRQKLEKKCVFSFPVVQFPAKWQESKLNRQRGKRFPQKMSVSAFIRQGKVSLPFLLWKSRWKRGRSCRSGRSRHCDGKDLLNSDRNWKKNSWKNVGKFLQNGQKRRQDRKKQKKNICLQMWQIFDKFMR